MSQAALRFADVADLGALLKGVPGVVVLGTPYAGAALSENEIYRYALWRQWQPGRVALVQALNPSKATHDVTDQTLRRLCSLVRRDGFSGLWLVNMFGLRSTDPKSLVEASCPEGPANDVVVDRLYQAVDYRGLPVSPSVIVACGMPPAKVRGHAWKVLERGPLARANPWCWGVTKQGWPRHPVRLRGDTPLVPWSASF